ncbi:UNVERIFIED_CONTAM: hypothetical protein HDU68_004104, partial [Siphonaria sp. JEL0065]
MNLPFSTSLTINVIPPEISRRFLLGLDPLKIKELRMLCKTFYMATSSASFALENLKILYPHTVRQCLLTKDFLYWDRFHQIELPKVSKLICFPFVNEDGEREWSVSNMDFALPPDADPAIRVHALVPIISAVFMDKISLGNNALFGPIPRELGCDDRLLNLTSLCLSGNQVSGQIPPALGNLCKLYYMNLSQNRLEGCIPSELGNLHKLRTLNLSDNRLDGSIPETVFKMESLRKLLLSRNRLSGNLDTLFFMWLEELDLSGNELDGCVPQCLGDFCELEIL